jgi:hypothetical protein
VKLSCGHAYDVGFLSARELKDRVLHCPICGGDRGIVRAVKLEHPSYPRSKRWIETQILL